MRFRFQNLNEGKRHWLYGRCWLGSKSSDRRARELRAEWTFPMSHCGWSITFGGGDSSRDLGVTFAIPFLCTIYLTLENAFRRELFAYDFDRGSSRAIGCYFFEYAFWYRVWVGDMASWSRGASWCRWYRQGSFHFANLLGKQSYERRTVKDGIPVVIPMPEGVYHGAAKIEFARWKRPLWFARERVSTWIDVPNGVPFSGKGENSWDCGDDGIFGCGVDGESIPKAIGHYVQSVLEKRKRYGMPSQAALSKAHAR